MRENLNIELSNLYSSIEKLIPGSLITEVEDTPKGSMTNARIDYNHIRSAIGEISAEQETYLSNIFSSLPVVYHINSVSSR